jgi:cyclic beta-1,2-glucan synthetase
VAADHHCRSFIALSSQLALAVVNFISTLLVKPHLLPRMDFSGEIPPDCRTLVVVPALLTTTAAVEDLVEALEVRFLANRNAHLHFGLLTDFTDAATGNASRRPVPFRYSTARYRPIE